MNSNGNTTSFAKLCLTSCSNTPILKMPQTWFCCYKFGLKQIYQTLFYGSITGCKLYPEHGQFTETRRAYQRSSCLISICLHKSLCEYCFSKKKLFHVVFILNLFLTFFFLFFSGVREVDDTVRDLRKENFNLKLRIYFLEERLGE